MEPLYRTYCQGCLEPVLHTEPDIDDGQLDPGYWYHVTDMTPMCEVEYA
jgi:hypothetical protein